LIFTLRGAVNSDGGASQLRQFVNARPGGQTFLSVQQTSETKKDRAGGKARFPVFPVIL
jgi:hypothetical protein